MNPVNPFQKSVSAVLIVATLLTGCANLPAELPPQPATIMITKPSPDFVPRSEQDPVELIRFGLAKYEEAPLLAGAYFEKAANLTGGHDLRRASLVAACMAYLRGGDIPRFLETEARLEETGLLIYAELESPRQDEADVITIARLLKKLPPPASLPDHLKRLVREVGN